jgi:hypothetical protein
VPGDDFGEPECHRIADHNGRRGDDESDAHRLDQYADVGAFAEKFEIVGQGQVRLESKNPRFEECDCEHSKKRNDSEDEHQYDERRQLQI